MGKRYPDLVPNRAFIREVDRRVCSCCDFFAVPQCVQEQLNAEKQRANHEARETAVQAQTETLQHSTEAQRLSVRAEAAEAEASRSQQECQRLHAEYDHKVRPRSLLA